MAENKKINTDLQPLARLLDVNGSAGSNNFILTSNGSGVVWANGSGSTIIGGPYLPLDGGTMNSGAAITFTVPSAGGSFINVNHSGNESWTIAAQSGVGVDDYLDIGISGGTRAMSWHETGNVGINETSPILGKLQVGGIIHVNRSASNGTSANPIFENILQSGLNLTNLSSIQLGNSFGSDNGTFLRFQVNSAAAASTPINSLTLDNSGNATFAGKVITTEIESTSTLLLDATSDITINAGGNDIRFKSSGVEFGKFKSESGSFTVFSSIENEDMIFKGNDGGSTVAALTLDMSEGGNATFAGLVTGIAPTADLNFATKKYVDDSITGGASYLGVWDPDVSLNSGFGNPSLDGGAADTGDYYVCSADGAATPNGTGNEPNSWETGDWVIWNEDLGTGGLWQKIDNTTVLSGNGTANKVARWTNDETIGDGPITFSTNDSTFAGLITAENPKMLQVVLPFKTQIQLEQV